MDALNSVDSKKLSPQENMRRLEREIAKADQRIRIRRDMGGKAHLTLGLLVALPLCSYMIFHMFAPNGVMNNHKATSGTYLYFAQTFLYRMRGPTAMYRPEIEYKETSSSLYAYSARVEQQRADGTLEHGKHHPTAWH